MFPRWAPEWISEKSKWDLDWEKRWVACWLMAVMKKPRKRSPFPFDHPAHWTDCPAHTGFPGCTPKTSRTLCVDHPDTEREWCWIQSVLCLDFCVEDSLLPSFWLGCESYAFSTEGRFFCWNDSELWLYMATGLILNEWMLYSYVTMTIKATDRLY